MRRPAWREGSRRRSRAARAGRAAASTKPMSGTKASRARTRPATASSAAAAIGHDGDGSSRDGARLNGYQEVSSISTTGFGSFHMKISNDGQSVDYTLSYRGIESAVTQAHIHFAQRSVN